MNDNVVFYTRKPAAVTRAFLKTLVDLREIIAHWAEVEREVSLQDLGHIATAIVNLDAQGAAALRIIEVALQKRAMKLVGDADGLVVLPIWSQWELLPS